MQYLHLQYELLFDPQDKQVTMYTRSEEAGIYIYVEPNIQSRWEIPELELKVGLHDDRMRFWFRGQLLPWTGELVDIIQETKQALILANRRLQQASEKLGVLEQKLGVTEQKLSAVELENAKLRELLNSLQKPQD